MGSENTMGRAAYLTPAYLSLAWSLMITYQLFTQVAVTTATTYLNGYIPTIGSWLATRIDLVVFVYAFAWIFLLSSAVPSLILGKERGVLMQFFVCLTLALTALIVQDVLIAVTGGNALDQVLNLSAVLQNPMFAFFYLSAPFMLMGAIDLNCRRKKKESKELEMLTTAYLETASQLEEETAQC